MGLGVEGREEPREDRAVALNRSQDRGPEMRFCQHGRVRKSHQDAVRGCDEGALKSAEPSKS